MVTGTLGPRADHQSPGKRCHRSNVTVLCDFVADVGAVSGRGGSCSVLLTAVWCRGPQPGGPQQRLGPHQPELRTGALEAWGVALRWGRRRARGAQCTGGVLPEAENTTTRPPGLGLALAWAWRPLQGEGGRLYVAADAEQVGRKGRLLSFTRISKSWYWLSGGGGGLSPEPGASR